MLIFQGGKTALTIVFTIKKFYLYLYGFQVQPLGSLFQLGVALPDKVAHHLQWGLILFTLSL